MAKMGAPTKYDPAHCEKVIEIMAKGLSVRSVAAELGVHRDTIYEWMVRYPDFSDSVKKGLDLAFKYFEEKLIELTENKNLKVHSDYYKALNKILSSRFHEVYGDKQKIDQVVTTKSPEQMLDEMPDE